VPLSAEQLPRALARGLARAYLVAGDEPLLVNEAADAIRAAARSAGYGERAVFFVERAFDWAALEESIRSPSLFAERRLIELRMPSGKPERGAALLEALAANAPADVLGLVITDRLDRKATDSAWVRAFERSGGFVSVVPIERAALGGWLIARARTLGLTLEPAAAQLIGDRVEGNLLAARQELEKLALLAPGGTVSEALALASVGDSARYDVFQLAAAAAAGDAARTLKVLGGLKAEGVEPTLILWALVRELRGLLQARAERGRAPPAPLGWNLAARPSARALARLERLPLERLIEQAAMTDRILKGIERADPWSALTGLAAALAGALQAGAESGRVAV